MKAAREQVYEGKENITPDTQRDIFQKSKGSPSSTGFNKKGTELRKYGGIRESGQEIPGGRRRYLTG